MKIKTIIIAVIFIIFFVFLMKIDLKLYPDEMIVVTKTSNIALRIVKKIDDLVTSFCRTTFLSISNFIKSLFGF